MSIWIEKMVEERLTEYASLYVAVFNNEPWNEHWTEKNAIERLEDFMKTPKFQGFALYDEGKLVGVAAGHGRVLM
ncbi:hypothetical protein ACFOU2_16390 [Bacillus songklensis]|uniref:GNAT family N-acetyltransferase n=1 Tax=Bacillus songklensis TaxID=1069116 RepID=A0ABV8B715_9BACI